MEEKEGQSKTLLSEQEVARVIEKVVDQAMWSPALTPEVAMSLTPLPITVNLQMVHRGLLQCCPTVKTPHSSRKGRWKGG